MPIVNHEGHEGGSVLRTDARPGVFGQDPKKVLPVHAPLFLDTETARPNTYDRGRETGQWSVGAEHDLRSGDEQLQ